MQQAPRHSEVNQKSPTRLEPNNHILATAVDGPNTLARQLGSDLQRVERAGQPRVEDLDAVEAASEQRGLEAATDGLDLGQLGHDTSVVAAALVTAPPRNDCARAS